MAALSANNPAATTNPGEIIEYKVKGSTHIYQGARVCVQSSNGYLLPGADTSGIIYVGIALEEVNNTGSDGAAICRVQFADSESIGIQTIAIASTATQATVGNFVYLVDDQTVDVAGGSTNKVAFGRVVKFLSAGWVQVNTFDRYVKSAL